ncbi:FAD-dependent oxidoreductase [Nesterenkonia ebinurensis]|uniref:FAD-dependent oxidoreductase n=1 Tax=Nesterenkonia ebinurensis TaxID=2608252 RepID=UPI00123CDBB5|nr:FAD-dependent oxidoreductase [Nesterenkonia ebinurensis]
MNKDLPIVVVGAGPVGLAAAAHLLEQGLEPLVLEAGEQAGAAVSQWGHIGLFSPWQYTIDAACRRLLEPTGWQAPRPTALPTGAELVEDYLKPLADTPELRGRIRLQTRVLGISRGHRDKTHLDARVGESFLVRAVHQGQSRDLQARAVIDASGTWSSPNPLGAAGLPAIGENDDSVAPHLLGPLPDVFGTDRARAAGRRVLVLGSGHSATNTLLNLTALKREEPGTKILWGIRGHSPQRSYGGGDQDGLPERGALGQRLRRLVEAGKIELIRSAEVQALHGSQDTLRVSFADGPSLTVDALAAATGFRPDLEMLRELRLELDPAVEAPVRLAPLIDPEHHSCGTVPAHGAETLAHPEEGFFIAGMKSYGRAPTFLLATGYEQVRSIAAHLAGGDSSPRNLNLPETGVCSGADPELAAPAEEPVAASSCCSGVADRSAHEPVNLGVPTGFVHGRTAE